MTRALVLSGFAGSLLACTGTGTDSTSEQTCDGAWAVEEYALTSDQDGVVEIPFTVGDDHASFMVLVASDQGLLSTEGVHNPEGDVVLEWTDWSDSRQSLTNAFYATDEVTTLNWPVREEDGALTAGEWTVIASTLNDQGYYKGRQDVAVTVIKRACLGATPGLPVTIAYAGGLESDSEVTAAVEKAADRWVEIYGAIGIDITLAYVAVDIDGSLPEPLTGGEDYASIYEQIGGGLVLVVGDDVGGTTDLYGVAGGIPGPLIASSHSVVVVSWLVHAGGDAAFDRDEIQIFAETMAHEAGHFLGLFHPVETDWSYWDALSDTKKCTTTSSCESALAANLMFPYPVCGAECVEQSTLSSGQVGILLNNVGVQ